MRLFLFREARPRGDVPCAYESQIVPAKQPIIEYNQRKEEHLLETTQQGN
jgi:hypothetical protein